MASLAASVVSLARRFGNRWARSPHRESPPAGDRRRERPPAGEVPREGQRAECWWTTARRRMTRS
eukprot:14302122-Alexandrium_andersonii.AAC.1